MTLRLPAAADLRALYRLAVPMVVVQVGIMLMGVVDTVFLGHVSATELAAGALGNLYVFVVSGFGMGILMSLDPVIAQAWGARDHDAVARGLQRGLVLGVLVSVPIALLMLPAEAVLRLLHQPAAVVPRAAGFARVAAPGILPLMVYIALRLGLQAMKRLRPVVITIVIANLVNAGLNVVFVFGRLGFPAMGSVGSSLSSTIGRWVMALLLLGLGWRHLRSHLRPWRRSSFEPGPLAAMLRLGLPIAVQMMIEFGAFGTVAVLAGWFGPDAMAGHQVAINLASLTFMVPLGIGSAAAVLVGHAIGEGDVPHARRVAGAALACGVSFMAGSAVLLVTMPRLFASAYSSAPSVVAVAAALIPIAGVFQVFDGLQVVSAGILRGIGDTRAPMLINVCAFWLVGMPVSLWLGFRAGGGVIGLWWGFVAGLAAVAALLITRVHVRMGRAIERVVVDHVS